LVLEEKLKNTLISVSTVWFHE